MGTCIKACEADPSSSQISKMARLRVLQQALHFRQNPFRIQSLTKQYLTSSSNQANLYIGVTSTRNLSTSSKLLKYNLPEIPEEDEPFIVKSPYSDVEIPETNLADYVWKDVDKWPERTALVCGMTGREYTYEMAHSMSTKFGSALKRLGAKKGDCLCMVVPNIPEFPIAFFGAAGVGITITTMNPTYRPEEIARQLENSGAKYILTIGLFYENIKAAMEIYPGIEKMIVLGMDEKPEECLSFIEMMIYDDGSLYDQDRYFSRSCDPHNEICALPYSSGT